MNLIGIHGKSSVTNKALLHYACNNAPTLIIDAANAANPHELFPDVMPEQFDNVYVIQCELLYVFRDIIKKLPEIVKDLNINRVIITTYHHLFNYGNGEENDNIIEHAWVLLSKFSRSCPVIIGVREKYAQRYCDMIIEVNEWVTPFQVNE